MTDISRSRGRKLHSIIEKLAQQSGCVVANSRKEEEEEPIEKTSSEPDEESDLKTLDVKAIQASLIKIELPEVWSAKEALSSHITKPLNHQGVKSSMLLRRSPHQSISKKREDESKDLYAWYPGCNHKGNYSNADQPIIPLQDTGMESAVVSPAMPCDSDLQVLDVNSIQNSLIQIQVPGGWNGDDSSPSVPTTRHQGTRKSVIRRKSLNKKKIYGISSLGHTKSAIQENTVKTSTAEAKAQSSESEEESNGEDDKQKNADPDFEDIVDEVLLYDKEAFKEAVMPPCKSRRRSCRLKTRRKDDGVNSELSDEGDLDRVLNDNDDNATADSFELKEKAKTKTRTIPCKFCDTLFYWQAQLRFHVEDEHSELDSSPDDPQGKRNFCDHCGKEFLLKEVLRIHINTEVAKREPSHETKEHKLNGRRHTRPVKKCGKCNKKFPSQYQLTKHRYDVHSPDTWYPCQMCQRKFSSIHYFNRHRALHSDKQNPETNNKTFHCDKCGKGFLTQGYLRNHGIVHREKSHGCSYCNKKFTSKIFLDAHTKRHEAMVPYNCSLCEKSFAKKRSLKSHMYSHSTEKAFKCEVCGKCFKRDSHLHTHKFIHAEKKPHKCDTCGRTFNQKVCLRLHLPCREHERRQKREEVRKRREEEQERKALRAAGRKMRKSTDSGKTNKKAKRSRSSDVQASISASPDKTNVSDESLIAVVEAGKSSKNIEASEISADVSDSAFTGKVTSERVSSPTGNQRTGELDVAQTKTKGSSKRSKKTRLSNRIANSNDTPTEQPLNMKEAHSKKSTATKKGAKSKSKATKSKRAKQTFTNKRSKSVSKEKEPSVDQEDGLEGLRKEAMEIDHNMNLDGKVTVENSGTLAVVESGAVERSDVSSVNSCNACDPVVDTRSSREFDMFRGANVTAAPVILCSQNSRNTTLTTPSSSNERQDTNGTRNLCVRSQNTQSKNVPIGEEKNALNGTHNLVIPSQNVPSHNIPMDKRRHDQHVTRDLGIPNLNTPSHKTLMNKESCDRQGTHDIRIPRRPDLSPNPLMDDRRHDQHESHDLYNLPWPNIPRKDRRFDHERTPNLFIPNRHATNNFNKDMAPSNSLNSYTSYAQGSLSVGAYSCDNMPQLYPNPCVYSPNSLQDFMPYNFTEGPGRYHNEVGSMDNGPNPVTYGSHVIGRPYIEDQQEDLSRALLSAMDPGHIGNMEGHAVFHSSR
ncbi:protein suppressor of hairy wing isoform X2 [Nematostella vectensis]|uniref:protein suppressor of hairy wing isoform X2 n=1 Tax=Nematostella vectensis TaxID=45351 RepID=UPI0020778F0F|nr:protein suppressor of hairy wing isoform X2 [Nematostella vectensis]